MERLLTALGNLARTGDCGRPDCQSCASKRPLDPAVADGIQKGYLAMYEALSAAMSTFVMALPVDMSKLTEHYLKSGGSIASRGFMSIVPPDDYSLALAHYLMQLEQDDQHLSKLPEAAQLAIGRSPAIVKALLEDMLRKQLEKTVKASSFPLKPAQLLNIQIMGSGAGLRICVPTEQLIEENKRKKESKSRMPGLPKDLPPEIAAMLDGNGGVMMVVEETVIRRSSRGNGHNDGRTYADIFGLR